MNELHHSTARHPAARGGLVGVCLLMLAVCLLQPVQAQEARVETAQDYHVTLDLVPETLQAEAGSTLWLALRLQHAERWHTYWINPGDAGRPTEIDWQLPEGVTAGTMLWPIPERFDLPADLVDFGYTGDVSLLVPLQVPDSLSGTLALEADVRWYECDEICIPGSAHISLDLPVVEPGRAARNEAAAWLFERTRASQPRSDVRLDSSFHFANGELNLLVQATEPVFANARSITFLTDTHGVIDYLARQRVDTQTSSLQLRQTQHTRVASRGVPERVGGLLLVTESGGQTIAYPIEAAAAQVDASALGSLMGAPRRDAGIAQVFLFALLGGMILNLMPCVFPVLSLKVLSLANARGAALREQRLHGLAYTAGVVLSFLALAAVLLGLQAGGAAIGWGFQLQQPAVVATLVFVFFVMGLSMAGVVEFGTSLMGIGGNLQEQEGLKGSFFTGILAAVVASPCTAPFMGAALGYAFTQSMPVAMTVFFALGLGMALPFLILSFVPALSRFMPRPGAWMLSFRQLLAFPLFATAVWLLWVLGNQAGPNGMAVVLAGCVLLGFACWLWQQRHTREGFARHLRTSLALGSVLLVAGIVASPLLRAGGANAAFGELAGAANHEPYSAARLQELRAEGKPVFVNMTAAWCITCLVNERVALSSAGVVKALEEKGVTYLKGDWTNNDPAITAVLREFETAGVPLYLMYPADSSRPAEVLPQILTEGIVLEALERI